MTNESANAAPLAANIDDIADRIADGELTLDQAATLTGWSIQDDWREGRVLVHPTEYYACCDGGDSIIEHHASAEEAAQSYVDDGEWGDIDQTDWVNVTVERRAIDEEGAIVGIDSERRKVALQPHEPDCIDGEDHDWQAPYAAVGGLRENPGVYGSGGGVTIAECCVRCGCGKHTDTWAQDMSDGTQGLESVRYEPDEYADYVRDRRLLELPAIAEDEGEWHTDRLVTDGSTLYLLHLNGGDRGSHQRDGNYFPDLLSETEEQTYHEALEWLQGECRYEEEEAKILADIEACLDYDSDPTGSYTTRIGDTRITIDPTSTGWSAYAEDVPSCVAAAETLAETVVLMSQALAIHEAS